MRGGSAEVHYEIFACDRCIRRAALRHHVRGLKGDGKFIWTDAREVGGVLAYKLTDRDKLTAFVADAADKPFVHLLFYPKYGGVFGRIFKSYSGEILDSRNHVATVEGGLLGHREMDEIGP